MAEVAKKIGNGKDIEKYKILLSTQQHSYRLAGEAGFIAIRSLILINGAAAVAILALFGDIGSTADGTLAPNLRELGAAGVVFALGAAIGVQAAIYMQKTMLEYVEVINEQMHQLNSKASETSNGVQGTISKLSRFRKRAWLAIDISLLFFVIGVLIGASGLSST
jgi:hypothetical protein